MFAFKSEQSRSTHARTLLREPEALHHGDTKFAGPGGVSFDTASAAAEKRRRNRHGNRRGLQAALQPRHSQQRFWRARELEHLLSKGRLPCEPNHCSSSRPTEEVLTSAASGYGRRGSHMLGVSEPDIRGRGATISRSG